MKLLINPREFYTNKNNTNPISDAYFMKVYSWHNGGLHAVINTRYRIAGYVHYYTMSYYVNSTSFLNHDDRSDDRSTICARHNRNIIRQIRKHVIQPRNYQENS